MDDLGATLKRMVRRLFRRGSGYALGGQVRPRTPDGSIPMKLSEGSAWVNGPDGEWVEVGPDDPRYELFKRINESREKP